jgi:hypothetical protein
METAAKVCSTDSNFFLAYLVPLDVDVTGNITAKLCEVWNEFNSNSNSSYSYYSSSTHFCPLDFSEMP